MNALIQSAGILVYRRNGDFVNVLLCKSGGPYYVNAPRGWGIPKGILEKNEDSLIAAQREFKEETNLRIDAPLEYLGKFRTTKEKEVSIFICEEDLSLADFKSNFFEMEYPKGSGEIHSYPENDGIGWFELQEAKEKIFVGQIQILEALERYLKG